MRDEDFLVMLDRARQVKKEILAWYQQTHPKSRLVREKDYDLYCPAVGNVRVKEDRIACESGAYSFEFEDVDGKPSGIAQTIAGEFVLVDKEYVIKIKTVSLLFLIKECEERRIIQMGFTTKDGGRAKGYLIPRSYILGSPYIEKVKRWFK